MEWNDSCQASATNTRRPLNVSLITKKELVYKTASLALGMKPFVDKYRAVFPEIVIVPKGVVYEVSFFNQRNLGESILFEEIEFGKGVSVQDFVEGVSLAEREGKEICWLALHCCQMFGAKWERRLIPSRNFDFDTSVGAILLTSNEANKWCCNDGACSDV
jgi:hypothetical protein